MKLTVSKAKAAPANRIYILDVLKAGELQTGRRKYDQVIDEVIAKIPGQIEFLKNQVFHEKCTDLNSINKVFAQIKKECNLSTSSLIFIDGHGDKERGLQVASGEFLDWHSFNQNLEKITYAAHGHLTVVASFCHSMSALERPDFGKPLPCPFYYGYADEVSAGDVEAESKEIISSLIQKGWVDESKKKIELYTEYTHVQILLAPLIKMFTNPQENAKQFPLLTKNKIREIIQRDIAKIGKTEGLNELLSKMMNLPFLARVFIQSSMHDTERRARFIAEILPQLEKINVMRKTI